MKKTFTTLAEFGNAVQQFEDRLETLEITYRNSSLVTNVNGQSTSTLNDLIHVIRLNSFLSVDTPYILFYSTEIVLPEQIKLLIEKTFAEMFYNA